MKKLLALLLLFGIVGCAAITYDNQISHSGFCPNSGEYGAGLWEECVKSTAKSIDEIEDGYPKAEAMDNINEEIFFASVFGGLDYAKESALKICNFHKKNKDAVCFITRTSETKYLDSDKPFGGTYKERNRYYSNAQEYNKKLQRKKKKKLDEEILQKQLILAALVDRCSNFGWKSEDNIASCVKQEAYRDLQLQEQEYELRLLEQQLASASYVEEKPFFLEALDILIDEAEKKENRELRMDIMKLKAQTRSQQSQRQTQAALQSLYRNNN